jgi:hypothetical protein
VRLLRRIPRRFLRGVVRRPGSIPDVVFGNLQVVLGRYLPKQMELLHSCRTATLPPFLCKLLERKRLWSKELVVGISQKLVPFAVVLVLAQIAVAWVAPLVDQSFLQANVGVGILAAVAAAIAVVSVQRSRFRARLSIDSRLAKLATLIPILVVYGHATAAPLLDQSYTQGPYFETLIGSGVYAETFTVGIAGRLDEVDVPLSESGLVLQTPDGTPITSDPDVQIFSTQYGYPDQMLASNLLPRADIPDVFTGNYIAEDFSYANIFTTVGEVLAIVVVSNDSLVNWGIGPTATTGATYLGGAAFVEYPVGAWDPLMDTDTVYDFHFKTYVGSVPEPASVLLAAFGAMMVFGQVKARRRALSKTAR